MRSVAVLGRHNYPDLAISTVRDQLFAIEVKIVRNMDGQALATGLGQALLYLARYQTSMLLIIDVGATITPKEPVRLDEISGNRRCSVIAVVPGPS